MKVSKTIVVTELICDICHESKAEIIVEPNNPFARLELCEHCFRTLTIASYPTAGV